MKEKKNKRIGAYKILSDSTLKGYTKEDLIEQIRILEHNWAAAEESLNNSAKNSEKIIAEQKAEIEWLTEVRNNFRQEVITLNDEKLELQRQVDELKKSQVIHIHIDDKLQNEYEYELKQVAKDTAKEILDGLLDIEVKDNNYETFFLDICEKLEKLSKKFGVEVE